jgi:hypothetical protein
MTKAEEIKAGKNFGVQLQAAVDRIFQKSGMKERAISGYIGNYLEIEPAFFEAIGKIKIIPEDVKGMKWVKASERLGEFKQSDIPEWLFFHPPFCKVDGLPAERPFFRKDIEKGLITFSYIYLSGTLFSKEIQEDEFDRIEWYDETPLPIPVEDGWIDAEANPPKKYGEYIAFDPNRFGRNKVDIYRYDDYNNSWFVLSDAYHPTHYMPLPAPPSKQ